MEKAKIRPMLWVDKNVRDRIVEESKKTNVSVSQIIIEILEGAYGNEAKAKSKK